MINKNYDRLLFICVFALSVVLISFSCHSSNNNNKVSITSSDVNSNELSSDTSIEETSENSNISKPWLTPLISSIELNGPYKVERVVDGDTIIININNESVRVRLIGVDAPESVSPDDKLNSEEGELASSYTNTILSNNEVYLEFDEERYDQYERLLAYVYYYDEDGDMVMFNRQLLYDGLAIPICFEPNSKYYDEFTYIYNSIQ